MTTPDGHAPRGLAPILAVARSSGTRKTATGAPFTHFGGHFVQRQLEVNELCRKPDSPRNSDWIPVPREPIFATRCGSMVSTGSPRLTTTASMTPKILGVGQTVLVTALTKSYASGVPVGETRGTCVRASARAPQFGHGEMSGILVRCCCRAGCWRTPDLRTSGLNWICPCRRPRRATSLAFSGKIGYVSSTVKDTHMKADNLYYGHKEIAFPRVVFVGR